MSKRHLPSLPPGAFHCSFQNCNYNFSAKKPLFQHISYSHGPSASRSMIFKCPYCYENILGKTKFDKHTSIYGDCRNVKNEYDNYNEGFEFPDEVQQGVCQNSLAICPIQINDHHKKTYRLTVLPAKESKSIRLTAEQRLIQNWVECWLKSRARGEKEVSINDMMSTATKTAYETQLYSSETIKILKGHRTEAGRKRYLTKNGALIAPTKVKMPTGEPAYVFPFLKSLIKHLEQPEIAHSLNLYDFPPLLKSIQCEEGIKTLFPMLHVDDVNLCNPLGSKKKKHSIRIFQYQLYNLPTWYLAKIEAKHPIAIAHAKSFKLNKEEAWKIILNDFLSVLKKFKDGGLALKMLEGNFGVRIGSILGDGLGVFEILGLSMSFGSHSTNVCFRCETKGGSALNGLTRPEPFTRTRSNIVSKCRRIGLAGRGNKQVLQRKYGIHFRTPFFDLPYVSCIFLATIFICLTNIIFYIKLQFDFQLARFDLFHIFCQVCLFHKIIQENIKKTMCRG